MSEGYNISVARRVREARAKAGLSQRQLAAAAGITQADLVRIEGGKRATPPTLPTILKLAQALSLNVADLVSWPEPKKEEESR